MSTLKLIHHNLLISVNSPTWPNIKCIEKSTLIDLILTKVPHTYSTLGVFFNDICDHCVAATGRNTQVPKQKPRINYKRDLKRFSEQAFFDNLFNLDWRKTDLNPEVEMVWTFFRKSLMQIVNKHVLLKKHKVKRSKNPWFSTELTVAIQEHNQAWAMTRKTNPTTDWFVLDSLERNALP